MNGMCDVRKAMLGLRCEFFQTKDCCQRLRGATGNGHPGVKKPYDEHWRGGPGLGPVAKDWDPREPRRMIAWLTPKGKEVVSRLLETVAP
jgi:hypothetical protein